MNILELVKKECVKNWIKENYIEVSENGELSIEYYIDRNEEIELKEAVEKFIIENGLSKNLSDILEEEMMDSYYMYDTTCSDALSKLKEIEDLTEEEKELLKDNLFTDFSDVRKIIYDTDYKLSFIVAKEIDPVSFNNDYEIDIDLSSVKIPLSNIEKDCLSLCFTLNTTVNKLNVVLNSEFKYTDINGKMYVIDHCEGDMFYCDVNESIQVDLLNAEVINPYSSYDYEFLQSEYYNDFGKDYKKYNEDKDAIALLQEENN